MRTYGDSGLRRHLETLGNCARTASRQQVDGRLIEARTQLESLAGARHVSDRNLHASRRRPYHDPGGRGERGLALRCEPHAATRAQPRVQVSPVASNTSLRIASAIACGSRSYGTNTSTSSHSHWPEVEKLK